MQHFIQKLIPEKEKRIMWIAISVAFIFAIGLMISTIKANSDSKELNELRELKTTFEASINEFKSFKEEYTGKYIEFDKRLTESEKSLVYQDSVALIIRQEQKSINKKFSKEHERIENLRDSSWIVILNELTGTDADRVSD